MRTRHAAVATVICLIASLVVFDTSPAYAVGQPNWVSGYPAARDSGVDLSWTAASGALCYEVQRRVGSSGSWATLSPGPGAATTFADVALPNRVSFDYQVRAWSASNCTGTAGSFSPVASAKPDIEPYAWHFNRATAATEGWGLEGVCCDAGAPTA